MALRRIGGETIYIKRAPLAIDPDRQTPYRDWENATLTEWKWCSVQEYPNVADEEDPRAREFALTMRQVWAPIPTPGAVVTLLHTDRVVHDNIEYEMVGFPRDMKDLTGRTHHWYFLVDRKQETNP